MGESTVLRLLGLQEYRHVWQRMQQFTVERTDTTADEIWITEHPPVYTFGLNGKPEHLLKSNAIPIVKSDRGGQITYHGPGQLLVYLLADLKRLNYGPRSLVNLLERAVIDSLAEYGVPAHTKVGAPGVYVDSKKIASIGLRIKRGCCYHGVSINNDMDLGPFGSINPCGYAGLETTQLAAYGVIVKNHELAVPIVYRITKALET